MNKERTLEYRVKPEPRVIWVNEYQHPNGSMFSTEHHYTKECAECIGLTHLSPEKFYLRTVKFVEVL